MNRKKTDNADTENEEEGKLDDDDHDEHHHDHDDDDGHGHDRRCGHDGVIVQLMVTAVGMVVGRTGW